jgi:Xaa-Pro aminopeptidase
LRAPKSSQELRSLQKGSRLIDQAFGYIGNVLRTKIAQGITEHEIARLIENFGRERGATGVPFEPIVAWGKNSAIPHHASSAQKIGPNNFLLLDFGFTIDGYQSDFTRTLFVGRPSARQREVYEVVLEAQRRALRSVADDVSAAVVDQAARGYISERGYGDFFTHNTGHGVGLEIHEGPNLSPTSTDVLRRNSVVTVEPGVYLPGKYGVRIEDMVLVGKHPRVFSAIDTSLAAMLFEHR